VKEPDRERAEQPSAFPVHLRASAPAGSRGRAGTKPEAADLC